MKLARIYENERNRSHSPDDVRPSKTVSFRHANSNEAVLPKQMGMRSQSQYEYQEPATTKSIYNYSSSETILPK